MNSYNVKARITYLPDFSFLDYTADFYVVAENFYLAYERAKNRLATIAMSDSNIDGIEITRITKGGESC